MSWLGKVWYRLCWFLLAALLIPFARVRARGLRHLPRRGPYLLLANHVSYLDPVTVNLFPFRRVHMVTSEHWFRIPILGRHLRAVGMIPKMKFIKDRSTMEAIQRWYEAGEVVGLFPEGRRSWDGATVAPHGRIGRLIKRLDATVVFARIVTGHQQQPRWASYPRWVPFRIEYSEPMRFDPALSEDEIQAEVQRRLTIDPDAVPVPRLALGVRLAFGLPSLLWACPACHQPEGLRLHHKRGNRVVCHTCRAEWRVDIGQRMHAQPGTPARDTTVPRAHRELLARLGHPPVHDRERFEADGTVVEGGASMIWQVGPGNQLDLVAGGVRVRLDRSRLALLDPDGQPTWQVALGDLRAISIEAGKLLQLRTESGLYRLEVVGHSPIKWQHFLWQWRDVARAEVDTAAA